MDSTFYIKYTKNKGKKEHQFDSFICNAESEEEEGEIDESTKMQNEKETATHIKTNIRWNFV